MAELKPCPLCGALPCDWTDDPHKAEVGLCWTLAKIREVMGVGEKPMMNELPGLLSHALEAQAAEIERLREALRKAKEPHWFYLGDDCSSDECRFGIDECISEDFEWDNKPEGDHVLQISGARPVPDMWVALHYFSDAEKDERNDDEAYTYTVHATEDEAKAALEAPHA